MCGYMCVRNKGVYVQIKCEALLERSRAGYCRLVVEVVVKLNFVGGARLIFSASGILFVRDAFDVNFAERD